MIEYQELRGTTGLPRAWTWVRSEHFPAGKSSYFWVAFKALLSSPAEIGHLISSVLSKRICLTDISAEAEGDGIKVSWRPKSKLPFFKKPTVEEVLAPYNSGVTGVESEALAIQLLLVDILSKWGETLDFVLPFVVAMNGSPQS